MQYRHPVFDRLQYCKQSETGQWEHILRVNKTWLDAGKAWKRTASDQKLDSGKAWEQGLRLSLVMVIWLGYSGDAQLELFAGFKSHLRSEVWASCNFLNEHSRTLLIGIPKPNSRCSSLPSVAEVPYMEFYFYLQVEVARCSWKDCMELSLLILTYEC